MGTCLLQGAALLNILAYVIERQAVSLILGGVMLIFGLSCFPTFGRLRNWIEEEMERLTQMRAAGAQD